MSRAARPFGKPCSVWTLFTLTGGDGPSTLAAAAGLGVVERQNGDERRPAPADLGRARSPRPAAG